MSGVEKYDYSEVSHRIGKDMYTVAMVAKSIGKSTGTVRRWLRLEECPKPRYHAVNGLVEMRLWDEDDLMVLRSWAEGIKPGPKPKEPHTTRRLPDQPFDRSETQRRVSLKDAKKLPPKERPAEKWARINGGKVVEKKIHTGKNEVTVLALEKNE